MHEENIKEVFKMNTKFLGERVVTAWNVKSLAKKFEISLIRMR